MSQTNNTMTTFEDYEELIFLNLYKFLMLDTVYIYIFILLFVTWGSESVDVRSEKLLAPAILYHKEPARRIQSSLLRGLVFDASLR